MLSGSQVEKFAEHRMSGLSFEESQATPPEVSEGILKRIEGQDFSIQTVAWRGAQRSL